MLREEAKRQRRAKRSAAVDLPPEAEKLMDALRGLRKRLADEEGVPPYVVFHDATLLDMIAKRPATPAELLAVHGVGKARLARYGDAFLALLADASLAMD